MDQWGRCLYDHVRIPIPKPSPNHPQTILKNPSITHYENVIHSPCCVRAYPLGGIC